MTARSWITLGAIAAITVVLGVARGSGEGDPAAPDGRPGVAIVRPTILDFGRGTCLACRRMMPVLDEVREAFRDTVDVRYMDLSEAESTERARHFGVRVIPTQIFLAADGSEVFRHEGFLAREDIERKLDELGWISSR